MDCLPVSQKQMTALSSGDGPKNSSTSIANPPMQAPSSVNSKIPRYINQGNKCTTLSKAPLVDLPRKIIFPPKRPFDDIPRLDIPSSPDTGDDVLTPNSTTPSTLLSPSQSGDGSLVTLDSWKSGCLVNSGRCLCRRGNRSVFHSLIDCKDNEENSSTKADEMTGTFETSVGLESTIDASFITTKDSGDEADIEAENTVRSEKESRVAKEELEENSVKTNDSEEINVSFTKPLNFQFCRSENTCSSTTLTDESVDQSLFLKAKESEPFFCPVESKVKNAVKNNEKFSSSPCLKAAVRTETNELQNRLQKMIDYGKNLLVAKRSSGVISKSEDNSNLDREELTSTNQTLLTKGRSTPAKDDSLWTDQNSIVNSVNSQSNLWQTVKLLTDGIFRRDTNGLHVSSPHLCLLNSAKFSNSTTTEDWYNTSRDHLSSCDRCRDYFTSKSSCSGNKLEEIIPKLQLSQSTSPSEDIKIDNRTMGVQVDLIDWDSLKKPLIPSKEIGIQVNIDPYAGVRPATRTRTLVCDLSTPVLKSPMSSLSVACTSSTKCEIETRVSSLPVVSIITTENSDISRLSSIPVSTLQKSFSPTKSTASISKSPDLNFNTSSEAIDIASSVSLPSSSEEAIAISEDISETKTTLTSISQIRENFTSSTPDIPAKSQLNGRISRSIPVPFTSMASGDKSRVIKDWKTGARSSNSSTNSTSASKIPGLKPREASIICHRKSTSTPSQQLTGQQQQQQQHKQPYPLRKRQPSPSVDSLKPNLNKKSSEKWGKNMLRVKGTNSTDTSQSKRFD